MKIYVDNTQENCNNCIFRQNMSQHWDLEDYCFLNRKSTIRIIINKDCPLRDNDKRL